MPNATLHHGSVLGRCILSHTWSCWNHVECESLHVFTEAVLLFAAWLTVDHQVRHLHSNLCLFLNFLLLPDLRLDRKKTATSCLHTLGGGGGRKKQRAHVCGRLLYALLGMCATYMYVPNSYCHLCRGKWLSRLASCSLLYCWLMARWVMSQDTLYHSKSSSRVPAARSNCSPSSSLFCSCNTWGFPFLPFFTTNETGAKGSFGWEVKSGCKAIIHRHSR